jgi:Glycosyltransferase
VLQARLVELGLAGRVHLCGHRDDLQQLYRAFDWLLVPSRAEGLGLVVQEAVIAGVPVICSDLPVFREQLLEAGIYLPIGNVEAWALAVEQCDTADPVALAARQRQVLAPEAAWRAFRSTSMRLLRG